MKRFYIFFIIILFFASQGKGSDWEYLLSKVHTYDVVRGNRRIYFLSEGGIFYFDQRDNSINAIAKVEKLSGSDFSGIEYSYETNSLIVFYKNSMVDIIPDDNDPISISDINRKNIAGNKTIYNATCYNNLCYLSCGFGIVVLDIVNREIKDSFIIGDDGSYEVVYDVAIDNENIYAGMADGIKFAPLNSPNLLDYHNWQYVDNSYVQDAVYKNLEYISNRVWAVFEDTEWSVDRTISRHKEDVWYPELTNNNSLIFKRVSSLSQHGDKYVSAGMDSEKEGLIMVIQSGVGVIEEISEYKFSDYDNTPYGTDTIPIDPRSAIVDGEGVIWIADYNYGAIRYQNGVFDILNPGGPVDNGVFSMTFSNNKLWIAGGGRNASWDNSYSEAMFQSYVASDDKWEAFSKYNIPELIDYRDVVAIAPSPGDPNHIFVGTWGYGILEFKDGKYITTYNETNSSLGNIYPGQNYVRIGGMAFDSKGNLWVSNGEVENVISRRSPDGSWKSYYIPELDYDYKLGKIIITKDDVLWMIVPREKTYGLYVMKTDGSASKHLNVVRMFRNAEGDYPLVMNDVYDIVEDKEGAIWVATSQGICVYKNPEEVFTEEPYYGEQPGVDLNDGLYHPLLETSTATAIAVDGGNQKYIGTKSAGVYLVSPSGEEEIEHWTVNSEDDKIISNGIISLEYDGINGILYVGTDRGLITYKTPSKEAYDQFTNVYAYPNPVRAGYEGDIYITGLMEESSVKITTVSGQLVYETTSIGGQATWNGCDLAGNKVHTGVYLVFCASKDGMQSAATKILFIKPRI